jgi:hypothetical protein
MIGEYTRLIFHVSVERLFLASGEHEIALGLVKKEPDTVLPQESMDTCDKHYIATARTEIESGLGQNNTSKLSS